MSGFSDDELLAQPFSRSVETLTHRGWFEIKSRCNLTWAEVLPCRQPKYLGVIGGQLAQCYSNLLKPFGDFNPWRWRVVPSGMAAEPVMKPGPTSVGTRLIGEDPTSHAIQPGQRHGLARNLISLAPRN